MSIIKSILLLTPPPRVYLLVAKMFLSSVLFLFFKTIFYKL